MSSEKPIEVKHLVEIDLASLLGRLRLGLKTCEPLSDVEMWAGRTSWRRMMRVFGRGVGHNAADMWRVPTMMWSVATPRCVAPSSSIPRPDWNKRRQAWKDLSTLAICFSAPHQSASYEASMMQRDGRGEAVLMPLGDRFGDPISESAALRATFLERPESLASCSRAPRDCGARSTTVASLGIIT